MIVAFDVDNTLVREDESVNWDVVQLMMAFHNLGATVVLWSGGGYDYAERWGRRLGLDPFIDAYLDKDKRFRPDLTVDDGPETDFGCPNLLVKNISTSIRNDLDAVS